MARSQIFEIWCWHWKSFTTWRAIWRQGLYGLKDFAQISWRDSGPHFSHIWARLNFKSVTIWRAAEGFGWFERPGSNVMRGCWVLWVKVITSKFYVEIGSKFKKLNILSQYGGGVWMARKTWPKCPEGAGGTQLVPSAGLDLGCGLHSWKLCCRHTDCRVLAQCGLPSWNECCQHCSLWN